VVGIAIGTEAADPAPEHLLAAERSPFLKFSAKPPLKARTGNLVGCSDKAMAIFMADSKWCKCSFLP